MTIDDPKVVAEVTEVFHRYELALMSNDLGTLDALFHAGPTTVRYGVGEVLYGIDEIRAFRTGRGGGSPQRQLGRLAIAAYGEDLATANVEFFREGTERRGRQSQTWVRFADGGKIVSAHVSIEGALS
jgi:hypothetical protein